MLRSLLSLAGPAAHIIYPGFILVLLLGTTIALWRYQRGLQQVDLHDDTVLVAGAVARHCRLVFQDEMRPVRRLAREITSGLIRTPEDFTRSAMSVQRSVPSLRTIAWLREDGSFMAVSTAQSQTQATELSPARWGDVAQRVKKARRSGLQLIPDTTDHWFVVPLWVHEGGQDGFRGLAVARAEPLPRSAEMFDDQTRRWFSIELRDAQHRVVYSGGGNAAFEAEASESIAVGDQAWTLQLRPTHEFAASRRRKAASLILWGGLIITCLSSAIVSQALRHRRRDQIRNREHLDALEAVNQVSAAIAGRPGASTEVLQQLAEVAGRVMGMSILIVTVYDPSKETMRVVFRQGLEPLLASNGEIDGTPCPKRCMQSGEVLAVEDTQRGGPFEPQDMAKHGIRSVLLMPLVVTGEAMGVIMLADRKVRRFTDAELRLAKLLATEAAVTLLNHRLHSEMDAALHSLRRLLSQRETLYAVNTVIQYAGSPKQAFDRIAELAPRALDVDLCAVILRTDDPEIATIAAVTQTTPPFSLPVNTFGSCAHASTVFRTRQPVIIEDAANDEEYRRFGIHDVGSALYVPLTGEAREVQGILSLMRRTRGSFDDEQVKLAQVFAARAAAAIHAARLYEKSRRQAETNATLLRELNHRVKNNLASIVGLLSAGAPKLQPEARVWLDRAVERIHTMARAHDLFSGGISGVGLADLVDTTLASVISARGPDVQVDTDVSDANVSLSTDHAVTLAMVLHELAYNALAHALTGGGRLLIRGRMRENGRVVLEVIDEPAAALVAAAAGVDADHARHWRVPPEARARAAGMGLELVRGLVGRELRGIFTLSSGSAGGTVATVEFTADSNSVSARSSNNNPNGNGHDDSGDNGRE
jgi:two-component sensor histidine kinase